MMIINAIVNCGSFWLVEVGTIILLVAALEVATTIGTTLDGVSLVHYALR